MRDGIDALQELRVVVTKPESTRTNVFQVVVVKAVSPGAILVQIHLNLSLSPRAIDDSSISGELKPIKTAVIFSRLTKRVAENFLKDGIWE